ncbi:MAG: alpha/beta fold hydrolase [Verrucomicrobia bacterium]|nr:alpha/beta fold hydrolase [Verrucomicrobiota bacterium]
MKLRSLAAFALFSAALHAAPLAWKDAAYTTHEKVKTTIRGQTATLTVPEAPAKPAGAQVQLALMRLPATTATPAAPVVYLHGGPGGAGAEHLESPDFRAVFAALQQQGDVIIYDQRGCGQSLPSLIPARERFPAETLATRGAFLAHLEKTSVAVRDRLIASGHDPHRYTVLESVADLEALRVALGAEKIRLIAHSYGTQLAQAYVRAYPQAVERLVLVGSRGMDTSRKLPAEADDMIARIAELARTDPTVGAKFPDLVATLRRVLAKLDAAPIAVELEDEKKEKFTLQVGGFALRFIIAKFYLNDPDNTKFLPKLLDELDAGRRPWSLVFNLGQLLRSPISYTWLTTDAASGVTPARAELIRSQAATALLGEAMNFPFPEINRAWAMADLGDAFRAPVRSDVPTLFVAGTLDGITPVAQTREIMAGFANARLLVVTNAGHNSQLRPAAVIAGIAGFFRGEMPPASVDFPPMTFMPLIATNK